MLCSLPHSFSYLCSFTSVSIVFVCLFLVIIIKWHFYWIILIMIINVWFNVFTMKYVHPIFTPEELSKILNSKCKLPSRHLYSICKISKFLIRTRNWPFFFSYSFSSFFPFKWLKVNEYTSRQNIIFFRNNPVLIQKCLRKVHVYFYLHL